jgi:hypothetical protein
MVEINGQWRYADTGGLISEQPDRPCPCGLDSTQEGHDGCLGTLPGPVANACCGHGDERDAYVQFDDGTIIRGDEARSWQDGRNGRER